MAKTPLIQNTAAVADALSVLEHRKKLKVSYHLSRTFEDAGLIIPVMDSSKPGRARRNHELTATGIKVLERYRKAKDRFDADMEKARNLYMKDTANKKEIAA